MGGKCLLRFDIFTDLMDGYDRLSCNILKGGPLEQVNLQAICMVHHTEHYWNDLANRHLDW